MQIKSLTIYCSSSNLLDQKYYDLATKIGEFLAKNNISVVYGGGNVGMMGKLSKSTMDCGGKVTGIIPKFLNTKEIIGNSRITELITVETMSERKEKLFELGDAILILPGGSGTIEEATEVISWRVLGVHQKKIIIFNYDNFWDNLINMYKEIKIQNFGNKNLQNICEHVSTFRELTKLFQ